MSQFALAVEQYEKFKELRPEDVKMLKEWADLQPHLPKMTELEIILFLHACLYSQEYSKSVIDLYWTVRTHCPEIFNGRSPLSPELQKHMNLSVYQFLPGLTPDGTSVIYVKLMDKNPSNFNYVEQVKLFLMVYDLYLMQEGLTEGHTILFDMEGGTLTHLAKCGIMTVKKIMYYLQEALPARRRGLHFINVVPFMDKVLALMKPFMKKELMEMLHVHTEGLESLYRFVPKEMLPRHLGGDGPTPEAMHEKMKRELVGNASYFAEEEKRRVDETRRPGKAKNAGDLFGVEGTFKKLDID